MSVLYFNLAELKFEFQSAESAQNLRLSPPLQLFNRGEPSATAGIYQVDAAGSLPLAASEPDGLIWGCKTWRMGRTADGQIAIEISIVPDEHWIPIANLAPDFSKGSINPLASRTGALSSSPLNHPYDQVILLSRLLYFDAVAIHASGVVIDGQGLIFAGRSGIGKTTMARLWRKHGARLLNDDRVILRREGRRFLVSPTPWHGEDPEINVETVPLSAIFHLRQASSTRLVKLNESKALASLIAVSVAPFYSKEAVTRLVDVCAGAVRNVPSYSLEFTPDESAVKACRDELLNRR